MLVWDAEHNDRAGAYDTSNASVEDLEMRDTGVVPTLRAAFHQVWSAAVVSNVSSACTQTDTFKASYCCC